MSEEQEILDYEAHNARTALKLNKAEHEIERLNELYEHSLESRKRLQARVDALEAIKCPDSPGGIHRWNGDGQCLDCCNYATDLNDQALAATEQEGET